MSNETYRRGQMDALEKFSADLNMLKEALSPELKARAAAKIGITPEQLQDYAFRSAYRLRRRRMEDRSPERIKEMADRYRASTRRMTPESTAAYDDSFSEREARRRQFHADRLRETIPAPPATPLSKSSLLQRLKLPAAGLALAGAGYGAYRMLRDDPDEGSKAAMEKFAAPSALLQRIGRPALLGGAFGAAAGSDMGDEDEALGTYLKRVAKGGALGASLGAGSGLYGATRDPAAIASALQHLRRSGYRDNAVLKRVVPAVAEHGRDMVRRKGLDPNDLRRAIADQLYPVN